MRKFSFSILALSLLATGAGAQKPGAAPMSASAQSRELLPDEQVQQVLNRLTFGARPGDAERVRAMGVDAWIDAQLHPDRIDNGAVDALMSKYAVFNMKTPDIIHDYN